MLLCLSFWQLLDYEAKAADQVPLLMRMKKDDLALEKAIMSGDTDLGKPWACALQSLASPKELKQRVYYNGYTEICFHDLNGSFCQFCDEIILLKSLLPLGLTILICIFFDLILLLSETKL